MNRLFAVVMLMLSTGAGWAAPESGLPAFVVPDCLGVNIHFTGPEQKQVDQIAAAGFRFIRMDFSWVHIEKKKGEYDFKAYDELVSTLSSRNIRPLFILDYGNPLYDSDNAPCTDEGRAAFARFARAGAEHFRDQGVLWEIWNEPNLGKFWRPQANVEDYVKLAKVVYRALKDGDPGCTVLAPALAGWDYAFLESAFKLGLLECTDVVSLHAYGAAKPEDAARYYGTVRSLIREYAPRDKDVPIVSGEWGYTAIGGTTVERQAEYLARCFLVNMINGVRLSIWYDWHDDGPDPDEGEHHFGTVYLDFSEKPAYAAARTLMGELAGYGFAARLTLNSDEDYLALFRKGDDYRLAAWTSGKPHTVKIPLDVEKVETVSMTGERSQAEVKNGFLELGLTGAPQYVEPRGKSARWALEAAWTIDATTAMTDDGIATTVTSTIEGSHSGAEIQVSGAGLKGGKVTADSQDGDRIKLKYESRFVSGGESRPKVKVTLMVDGLSSPLVRIVELDSAACPTVDVLPPSRGELLIAVGRPAARPHGALKGKLLIGNTDGIRLEESSRAFELPPGKDRTIVRFKMTQEPAATYSFACRLVGETDLDLLRLPARRYVVVETFADGKPGEEVRRYQTELDGDSNIAAKAKLTYVKSPADGPSDTCARLDYEFAEGWRFVRVSPRPMIGIPGMPRSVKMWIKGDGQEGLARLRFTDSSQQTFQPDYGRMNYDDWRCLEAMMTGDGAGHWGGRDDGHVSYPTSWDTLFLLDSAYGRKNKGSVYLGTMMLCYD